MLEWRQLAPAAVARLCAAMLWRRCALSSRVMDVPTLLSLISTLAIVASLVFAGLQVRAAQQARARICSSPGALCSDL